MQHAPLTGVVVSFRALTSSSPPDPTHGYTYLWYLPEAPAVGQRVVVRGGDGKHAHAVVGQVVEVPSAKGFKKVIRLATDAEIQGAAKKYEAWLDLARRAAGLPTSSRYRKVPDGFDPVPPAGGTATALQASGYARTWWHIYKTALEKGRPADEIAKFKSVAHRWYAVSDKGGNIDV